MRTGKVKGYHCGQGTGEQRPARFSTDHIHIDNILDENSSSCQRNFARRPGVWSTGWFQPPTRFEASVQAESFRRSFSSSRSSLLRGRQANHFSRFNAVTLNHAVESLAINFQHSRRGLFVAARMSEYA